jgi:hypothetical protein
MTVEALVDETRRRGVTLSVEGEHIRFRGPNGAMTPYLVARLRDNKRSVLAILSHESNRESRANHDDGWDDDPPARVGRADALSPNWTDEAAEAIAWFERNLESLPRAPFALRPATRAVDPERFFASLKADTAAGPAGARARGGLLDDLRDLRAATAGMTESAVTP